MHNSTKMSDYLINMISIFFLIFFVSSIDYSGFDIGVLFTFMINGFISLYFSLVEKKNITIHRTFYIFVFIFFVAAPLQQYSQGARFWTKFGLALEYSNENYFLTNIYILLHMIMFEIGYKSKIIVNLNKSHFKREKTNTERELTQKVLIILTIISLACFTYLWKKGIIFGNYIENRFASNLLIQINNIIKYVPVVCFILYISQSKNIINKRLNRIFVIIQVIEIFIIYFPLSGSSARFILFGAYMSIYAVLFSKSKNKSLYFLIFIVGFFYIFSIFNVFKYSKTLSEAVISFTPNLVHVDFDAYQMFMVTIKYVNQSGICYGQNFLSAFFCFIPRSIFSWRSESTSSLIMRGLGASYENVSCPLIAEMYFAYGVVGIILLSYIVGKIVKKLDEFDFSLNSFKHQVFCLYVGITPYILRGSFLAGWSFSFAFLISTYFIYNISQILSNKKIVIKN